MCYRNISKVVWIIVTSMFIIIPVTLHSENTILIKKGKEPNTITIVLQHSDPVGGALVYLNARNGVRFSEMQVASQFSSSGVEVHHYLKDDTTLNFLFLTPVYNNLPAGNREIGSVTLKFAEREISDSSVIFISRLELVDQVKMLPITAAPYYPYNDFILANLKNTIQLAQNYPNPFNLSTTISYRLLKPEYVSIAIYDVAGRVIDRLYEGNQLTGEHTLAWNAMDRSGSALPSGMYIIRVQTASSMTARRMILLK
ncbi:MAG: T9SS type A sorting domain-containing protein [bacterium]